MTNSIQSNVTNTYIKSKFLTDPSPAPKTTVADTEPQKARSLETPAVVYSSSLSAGIAYRDSGHPNFDLSASSYAKFFGDGSSEGSMSLALGVVDPAAETLSQGKAFHEVVQAARASLNAGYERVREQGGGQGSIETLGIKAISLFQDFDRRALNAVVVDDTNQFTREEKEFARTLMIRQQSLAAGYYNGPNSLQDEYVDPFGGDTLSKLGASIEYLGRAHPEEKASVTYALDRANAEGGYQLLAEKEGRPIEVEFSEDPLVRLIREAMESLQKSGHSNSSSGAILNADDLRDQDWFAPFLNRFDAISTSREGA